MMATLWSVHAFAVIPIGSICLLLLLSDVRALQRVAMSACSVHVAFGSIRMSLSSIFAFFAFSVFAFQSFTVLIPSQHPQLSTAMTVEMMDRIRMREWRGDRNWWIALFACTIWFMVWRLQIWTKRYCLDVPKAVPLATEEPKAPRKPTDKKKD
jgi:hypothetical protein